MASQYWKLLKKSRYAFVHICISLSFSPFYDYGYYPVQKSGLRDLTTSKTPEASIAAALSRDTKLFERTAPSTYCVKSPYRKDPADSESVLSAAREKIRAFQNVLSDSEAEKEAEDAERDEDSG